MDSGARFCIFRVIHDVESFGVFRAFGNGVWDEMRNGDLKKHIKDILLFDGEQYSVPLAEKIEAATGKRVSTGQLYVCLTALEDAGEIVSRVGTAVHRERGGRTRKFWRLAK